MTITEADVVAAVKGYTYLSCQTSAEATAVSNTEANLLYNSASEVQGNFSLFWSAAELQVAKDEVKFGIVINDTEKVIAYAYLIQHYQERKFKDWDATEINLSNDLVKKSIQQTSGWAAYQQILGQVTRASVTSMVDLSNKHTDSEHYPDEWNDTQMEIDEIEFGI
jgi:hypothetical protein